MSTRFSDKAYARAKELYFLNKDFSHRPIVNGYTIDGITSKDLDDGINLSIESGNYLLEVSIADVAEYLQPDSELFDEIIAKSATVYRAVGNIPMIPRMLSENKLSLLPGQLRPTITFSITISPDLEILNYNVKETMFNNLRKFYYSEFDKVIFNNNIHDEEKSRFQLMSDLAGKLLNKRRENGALAFYDLLKGFYTNEEGMVIKLTKDKANHANIIIQEFMILTNYATGKFFAEIDYPFVFRNHTAKNVAPDRKLIMEQLQTGIMEQKYYDNIRTRAGLWFNRADYGVKLTGHFGLNLPVYSHVTSPIRRAPDLLNHCQIKNYISEQNQLIELDRLNELTDNINFVLNERKDIKAEKYKLMAKEEIVKKLILCTEDELIKLPNTEFEKYLKSAISTEVFGEELTSALKYKLTKNQADSNIAYLCIFSLIQKVEEPDEILNPAFRFLWKNPGEAVQILNFLLQKKIIDEYALDAEEHKSAFKAKAYCIQDGERIETENYTYANKKKDAAYKSAVVLIAKLAGVDEKYYDENKKNETNNPEINIINENIAEFNIIDESPAIEEILDSDKNVNYVGMVLEIWSKLDRIDVPIDKYQISGPAHSPIVTCEICWTNKGESYSATVRANNKKSSKQAAFKQVYLQMKDEIKLEPKVDNKVDTARNFVGEVQEKCTKLSLQAPQYHFEEDKQEKGKFVATLVFVKAGKVFTFTDKAQKKNDAKRLVAQKFLEEFDNIVELNN